MVRQFIPWFAVYALGVSFIWWLGRALFGAWPAVAAAMLTIGLLLWSYVAFKYAILIGLKAAHAEIGRQLGIKNELPPAGS